MRFTLSRTAVQSFIARILAWVSPFPRSRTVGTSAVRSALAQAIASSRRGPCSARATYAGGSPEWSLVLSGAASGFSRSAALRSHLFAPASRASLGAQPLQGVTGRCVSQQARMSELGFHPNDILIYCSSRCQERPCIRILAVFERLTAIEYQRDHLVLCRPELERWVRSTQYEIDRRQRHQDR